MESVAREAYARIRTLTLSARDLALHLETQPEIPFLHDDAPEVGLDDELSPEEKATVLRRALPKRGWKRHVYWRFRSMREHWDDRKAHLPKNFPVYDQETGLKWSEALFSIHAYFLHESVPTDWYRLAAITENTVNDLLGHTDEKPGILWKHRYTEDDGSPIKLTTHMARRLIGTLSERGHMIQEDHARWAGRVRTADNINYDHRSTRERAEDSRSEMLAMTPYTGRQDVQIHTPTRTSDELLIDGRPTHRTEYGFCTRNLMMLPCDKFVDCLNCTEHVCIKGDEEQKRRIKIRYEQALADYRNIIAAKRDGIEVLEQWLEDTAKTLVRTTELVTLLEAEDIADGTAIRLTDEGLETSHLKRVLADRLGYDPPSPLLERAQRLLKKISDG